MDAVFCITASNGLWALGSGLWALGSGLQARPAKTAIAAVSLQDVAGDGEVLIGAEAGCVRRHRGRDEVEQIVGPLYGGYENFVLVVSAVIAVGAHGAPARSGAGHGALASDEPGCGAEPHVS